MSAIQLLQNPIIIGVITFSCAIAIGILLALWHYRMQVLCFLRDQLLTWTGFFWFVNIVCMVYSAQNAGYLFGLYEPSGIFVGVALDLIIIVFTQSMLAAKARGERSRAGKILLFIAFCCVLSVAGNLAHNLHTNVDAQTTNVWFSEAIPYLVSLMPLLLIALAWVSDLKVNPLHAMDEKAYENDEKKRNKLIDIQIKSAEERERLETRAIAVEQLRRRNNAMRHGKIPGSFRWFWEKALDASEIIADLAGVLQPVFEPHIEAMKAALERVQVEHDHLSAAMLEAQQSLQMTLAQEVKGSVVQARDTLQAYAHDQVVSSSALLQQTMETLHSQLQEDITSKFVSLSARYPHDITELERSLKVRFDEYVAMANDMLVRYYNDVQTTFMQRVEEAVYQRLKSELHGMISPSQSASFHDEITETPPESSENDIDLDDAWTKQYTKLASWLSRGERTISVDDIVTLTGHSRKMVVNRIKDGTLRRSRNPNLFFVDSVIKWLKTSPLPRPKDTEKMAVINALNGHTNGHQSNRERFDNLVDIAVS